MGPVMVIRYDPCYGVATPGRRNRSTRLAHHRQTPVREGNGLTYRVIFLEELLRHLMRQDQGIRRGQRRGPVPPLQRKAEYG